MPLLAGTFDPARFNAVTLGKAIHDEGPHVCRWDELREDLRLEYIDHAQRVLDSLYAQGVIR